MARSTATTHSSDSRSLGHGSAHQRTVHTAAITITITACACPAGPGCPACEINAIIVMNPRTMPPAPTMNFNAPSAEWDSSVSISQR